MAADWRRIYGRARQELPRVFDLMCRHHGIIKTKCSIFSTSTYAMMDHHTTYKYYIRNVIDIR